MARTFDAVPLIETYEPVRMGQCDECGDGATEEEYLARPSVLYQVELVGTIQNLWSQTGIICRDCYEASKERTFIIYGGGDVLSEHQTLEACLTEITSFLADPDDWGRYAPFTIRAQRYNEDVEEIATITMPADDMARSRKLNGWERYV